MAEVVNLVDILIKAGYSAMAEDIREAALQLKETAVSLNCTAEPVTLLSVSEEQVIALIEQYGGGY